MSIATLRRLRRVVQALALLGSLALVVYTLRDARPILPGDTLLRLDPLTALAAMVAGRRWLARFLPAVVVLGAAVVLGRAWCGWLCPVGTLIDWTAPDRRAREGVPEGWRRLKHWLLLVILFGAAWTSLTLVVLDPLTIFVRAVGGVALPGLTWLVTEAELRLYRVEFLREGLGAFDRALRGTWLSHGQTFTVGALGIAGLLVALLVANLVARRAWCRYACPLGALHGLVARAAWVRRRVSDRCVGCGLCEGACPMGTVDADLRYASDSAECILCLDCAAECPRGAISFGGPWRLDGARAYDPARRQVVGALGLSVGLLGLLKIGPRNHHPHPYLLRPPGAVEEHLLSACIRCGQCLRVCPTHGLQPAVAEAGIEGLWTPILVPRLGQCEFACNACGEACPTGAIPPLTLEEKQAAVIGQAYIDPDLCIPWTGRGPCAVCEEMCPLGEKAIHLVEHVAVDPWTGEPTVVLAPVVRHELCIGCGLCERQCPVKGEAAIRVMVDPMAL